MRSNQTLGWIVVVSLCALPALGQEWRPATERQGSSARSSAAEPESATVTSVLSRETQAAAPRLVKFSGVLAEPRTPLNGPVEMTLALYKDELGGEPLWTETQSVEIDKEGRYTVLLGATQSEGLPVELFPSGETRWLAVEISGQPQQPRTLLVGVPYALKAADAEKLGGKPASDFVSSAGLSDQVLRVIEAQTGVASQTSSTRTLQPAQTKSNSTFTPQMTAAGPMFPPSTFSGTNATQIVLVQQKGPGSGLVASTASSTGSSGVVGLATSTSTSNSVFQNGVYGQNDGAGAGVAGIATNPSVGVGVYGQSANFTGVFGQTFSPNTNGVAGIANATTGFSNGLFGQSSAEFGTGVFGNATPTNGQATGVYGQTVNWVGVGGQALATSGGPAYGVWGDSVSTGGTGVAGFEDATSGFTNGVFGQSVSPNGNGVAGFNNSSTGGNGVAGFAGATSGYTSGVFGQSSSNNGQGVLGVSNAADGGSGVNGFAAGTTGNAYGVMGTTATTGFGAGVIGGTSANTGTAFGVFGRANSPNGNAVFGHAASSSGFPTAVVGFLDSTDGGVAGQFVAHGSAGLILQGLSGSNFNQVFSVDAGGNLSISGNLIVGGSKSSTVQLQNGREVALYAVESPENWFEDFGSGEMNNGVAWVPLDSSFVGATNATVTYHVFLTANGDSNGLYVSRKTPAGFEVREHGGGASNVAFDYRIVVKRRGYETIRMAEIHRDIKISELSREHLARLSNSGNLKKMPTVRVPQIASAPSIRPAKPRRNVPALPKPSVPQPPRLR
jgi:hypothetical protein